MRTTPSAALSIVPDLPVGSCPCCGYEKFRLFDTYEHLGIELHYTICRRCSLVLMNPRFCAEDLNTFYEAEYRRLYAGSEQPTPHDLKEQRERARHLARLALAQFGCMRSHLDIGCSTGELLLEVRLRCSTIRSAGVEPSEAHRARCRREGLIVYPSLDEMLEEESEPFQLVSLSHVLEHLPDPVAYLKTLRSHVLASDGYLLIEVPNLLGHVSYEVAHLTCFWKKTLVDLLGVAGYRVHYLKIHSIPRDYVKKGRYLTVIARPVSDAEAATTRVDPYWWRAVRLMRIKGLSGRSWPQLVRRAVFHPQKSVRVLGQALRKKSD